MDQLFEVTFSAVGESGTFFSKCGKCKRYMHLISLRQPRLFCKTCNDTYSLPSNGSIKLFKELKCPLDNFELVLFSQGSKSKGYIVCPCCYNHPPFGKYDFGMSCNLCLHESCQFSLNSNRISCCFDCDDGSLVLDASASPHWKISCNSCRSVSNFLDSINNVSVRGNCSLCQAKTVLVTFREREQRPDQLLCLFCDERADSILEKKVAPQRNFRGRGRGKGRRKVGDNSLKGKAKK